jgi:hypothetical protein
MAHSRLFASLFVVAALSRPRQCRHLRHFSRHMPMSSNFNRCAPAHSAWHALVVLRQRRPRVVPSYLLGTDENR